MFENPRQGCSTRRRTGRRPRGWLSRWPRPADPAPRGSRASVDRSEAAKAKKNPAISPQPSADDKDLPLKPMFRISKRPVLFVSFLGHAKWPQTLVEERA